MHAYTHDDNNEQRLILLFTRSDCTILRFSVFCKFNLKVPKLVDLTRKIDGSSLFVLFLFYLFITFIELSRTLNLLSCVRQYILGFIVYLISLHSVTPNYAQVFYDYLFQESKSCS